MKSSAGGANTPSKPPKQLKSKDIYRLTMAKNLLKLSFKLRNCSTSNIQALSTRQKIKLINKQLNFPRLNNSNGSEDTSAVNELAERPLGRVKYMKRQYQFKWLSTHIWHAKRSHLIKRWGFQIPLKPTQKLFRLTHRNFNFNGSICWDKSYFSMLQINSNNVAHLSELIAKLTNNKKIYQGVNTSLIYRNNEVVGISEIILFPNMCLINLHPSAYEIMFNFILSVKPEDVDVIDNRYALGSIELAGPDSLACLNKILSPVAGYEDEFKNFQNLLNDGIPNGSLFTLMVRDPRIHIKSTSKPKNLNDDEFFDLIIKSKNKSVNYQVAGKLFSSQGRTESYKDQFTIKQLSKPEEIAKNQSEIPILIYKSNDLINLVCPWFWVQPFWINLNRLSQVNHGGLLQQHQFQYERNKPFYPIDYPFTMNGRIENYLIGHETKTKHDKKPLSKKVNYSKLVLNKDDYLKGEIGDFSCCDWDFLQLLKIGLTKVTSDKFTRTSSWDANFNREISELHDVYEFIQDNIEARKQHETQDFNPVQLYEKNSSAIVYPKDTTIPLQVTPVSFRMASRGAIKDNARIYAVPEDWDGQSSPHSKYLVGFVTTGSYNLKDGFSTGIGCIDSVFVEHLKSASRNHQILVRNVGTTTARKGLFTVIDLYSL